MRVLLVAAASSIHAQRWANALVDRGLEVHLATQHDPLPSFDRRVVLHRLPHFGGLGYLLNRWSLRSLVQRVKPSVVNAHYASGYGTLAVRTPSVPLVLNVWGSDVYEFPDTSRWHHWLLCRNLRRADAVVSTSAVMAVRTKDVCPGLGRITVVPFGVDLDRFAPAQRPARDEVVIGTVKTLSPKYGIDTLIDAFKLVRDADPRLNRRLRIVGGGSQRKELEQRVQRLGMNEVVDFVGGVGHADVPAELNKLDVYVALSRTHSESFGVAVIEASACGLPVVVAHVGGLPEVVEREVTGFIVPPDDPVAAAKAISALLGSPELRKRMGDAGRARVEREYDWNSCVDRMLAVYQNVIKQQV
jgi:L-malate glycosyltransferase